MLQFDLFVDAGKFFLWFEFERRAFNLFSLPGVGPLLQQQT
jgi:hypothetical protein